jgi:hypothetical protein
MSCLETQPSTIQLDTVTDDVHKTEPFPEKGFTNTCLEMVEMIDRCPGIKVRSLLGEEVTQSKG